MEKRQKSWNRVGFRSLLLAVLLTPAIVNIFQICYFDWSAVGRVFIITLILSFLTCKTAKKFAKLEQDLKESIEARDEFISLAAHELKTPLTTLHLSTQLAKRVFEEGKLGKEQIEKLLHAFSGQIAKMDNLIKDMLDLAVIRSGRLPIKRDWVNIEKLIQDIINRFVDAPITYHYHDGSEIVGYWDASRIDQIVTNLLTNALKYGGGKPVDVGVTAEDNFVFIEIKDQGVGISKEDQKVIFNRFERVCSKSNKIKGIGLGLYIVKRIVDANGGTISVDSEVGKGSTFIVKLPINAPDSDSV